jgi:hypothetical protein
VLTISLLLIIFTDMDINIYSCAIQVQFRVVTLAIVIHYVTKKEIHEERKENTIVRFFLFEINSVRRFNILVIQN